MKDGVKINFNFVFCPTEELTKFRFKPTQQWKQKFAEYIATVPPYYAQVSFDRVPYMYSSTIFVMLYTFQQQGCTFLCLCPIPSCSVVPRIHVLRVRLVQPLRQALRLMGAPTALVPDSFDGQMSYTIANYLRKLKKQVRWKLTVRSLKVDVKR